MKIAILHLSDGTDFVTNIIGYEDEIHFAQTNLGKDFLSGTRIVRIEFEDL